MALWATSHFSGISEPEDISLLCTNGAVVRAAVQVVRKICCCPKDTCSFKPNSFVSAPTHAHGKIKAWKDILTLQRWLYFVQGSVRSAFETVDRQLYRRWDLCFQTDHGGATGNSGQTFGKDGKVCSQCDSKGWTFAFSGFKTKIISRDGSASRDESYEREASDDVKLTSPTSSDPPTPFGAKDAASQLGAAPQVVLLVLGRCVRSSNILRLESVD